MSLESQNRVAVGSSAEQQPSPVKVAPPKPIRPLERSESTAYLKRASTQRACPFPAISLRKLKDYIEREGFKGYDPYDGLNSPVLDFLSFGRKFPRIAFTQLMKRSPLNLRPLLGIKKGYNPKGLGLFLWGFAKLYRVEKKRRYLGMIDHLLDLLDDLKSRGYSGNCWGYNFPWQQRVFYAPRFTPTVVNSSFIGHALIDTYRYTGSDRALEMAVPIKDFILNDLNRSEEDGTFCFSYTPLDHSVVHNANLLGASLLIRLYQYTGDQSLKDTALASLGYSMKCQRDDGSWLYADTSCQGWIDSFHTGFNLLSLLYFLEEGFGREYRKAFEKGVEFYARSFFLADGTPKYYPNRVFPADIHSAAQAVVFFSRMGEYYHTFAKKIVQWMIDTLQDREGFFYFQKKRLLTNKIPYIRWAQAWAFHALTDYLLETVQ